LVKSLAGLCNIEKLVFFSKENEETKNQKRKYRREGNYFIPDLFAAIFFSYKNGFKGFP
jgi:hypothetical protein